MAALKVLKRLRAGIILPLISQFQVSKLAHIFPFAVGVGWGYDSTS